MAEIGVINASPLIFLSRGGHLNILGRFYERLLVPSAVISEIMARGDHDATVYPLFNPFNVSKSSI